MAKNDFKAFATDRNANVISQEEWEALPALLSGFTAGKASSAQVNKVIRQASFIAAALAQFVSDKTQRDVLDNGDLPGFVELLGSGFAVEYLSRKNPFGDIKSDGTVQTALENLGLGEAAKRDVGTGENQIPDMASFASGDGWMKLPNGKILQYGRGAVTPTLSTQTMRITFSIPFPKKADCAMLTHSGDGGAPLGAGRGFVMTAEGPTLTGFNSAYRTSSTSDTVSMNYSWWAVGE
ncbi:TPA: gp53-like domain-containing protein [Escherichia coli]